LRLGRDARATRGVGRARVVPVGVRAFYASLAEETAQRETRKGAFCGRSQIDVADYLRMTYVISVATHRNLNHASGYSVSQELAAIWIAKGIDSVVFPSVTGAGRNVAIYLANAGPGCVAVRNRDEIRAAFRRQRTGPARPRMLS
jgi:hypothetical protein